MYVIPDFFFRTRHPREPLGVLAPAPPIVITTYGALSVIPLSASTSTVSILLAIKFSMVNNQYKVRGLICRIASLSLN